MEWRLRRAEQGDAAAIALVAAASFLDAFYDDLTAADLVAHVAANSSAQKFASWIADWATVVTLAEHAITGAPIGYSVLTTPDLPDTVTDDIELRRIYTLPCGYGTGLAAELLEQATSDAIAQGKRRLVLGVYGQNHRAQRFYRKHNFVEVGARRFLVGATWHNDLVLARSL